MEGTLIEFKSNAERRFDEIHAAAELATNEARAAQEKADDAHAFSKQLVQKAGFMGGAVSFIFFGIVWVFENIPKAVAAISGGH